MILGTIVLGYTNPTGIKDDRVLQSDLTVTVKASYLRGSYNMKTKETSTIANLRLRKICKKI